LTSPSVPYKALLRNGKEVMIENAIMAPYVAIIKHLYNLWLLYPEEYSAIIF